MHHTSLSQKLLFVLSVLAFLVIAGCGSTTVTTDANDGDMEAVELDNSDGDEPINDGDIEKTEAEADQAEAEEDSTEADTDTDGDTEVENCQNWYPVTPQVAFCDLLEEDLGRLERICYQEQPSRRECSTTKVGAIGFQCSMGATFVICYDTNGAPVTPVVCIVNGERTPAMDSIADTGFPGCDYTVMPVDGDEEEGESEGETEEVEPADGDTEVLPDGDTEEVLPDGDTTEQPEAEAEADNTEAVDGDIIPDGDSDITEIDSDPELPPVCEPACVSDDPCKQAVCVNGTCLYDLLTGLACDDGNACTRVDTCLLGECIGGDEVVCQALDQCHLVGECNPATGTCTSPAANDGTPCNDVSLCTTLDTCLSGVCGGAAVVCNDNNGCTNDSCDPEHGCAFEPNLNACDDHNACTTGDICSNGGCSGTTISCDDLNPCTDDSCDAVLGCRHVPNTASCDDGNWCTVGDVCGGGTCHSGATRDCSTFDSQCSKGICDEANDQCVSDPRPLEGKLCDADANGCTKDDYCHAGDCVKGTVVDCTGQNDQCNTGVCYSTGNNSSVCLKDPTPKQGNICDDGAYCTMGETCNNGECMNGTARNCTVFTDQCNVGTCDETHDTCVPVAVVNGTVCNDDSLCTQSDTCQFGICKGDNPVVCGAQDQCHFVGTCNPSTGTCSNPVKPDNTTCDDGSLCTKEDKCTAGTCGGSTVLCDDNNVCTDDVCLPKAGCLHANNFNPCDDGNACTQGDMCGYGRCEGEAVVCDDGNVCTDDYCDIAAGCKAALNAAPCDDSNACTQVDTCLLGQCVGGNPKTCPAEDECTYAGICEPSDGLCRVQFKPEGLRCNDNDSCTVGEYCALGVCGDGISPCGSQHCQPMSPSGYYCSECWNDGDCQSGFACLHHVCVDTACDDDNACTVDTFNPVMGCRHDQRTCDDGNACTFDFCDTIAGCKTFPLSGIACSSADPNVCNVYKCSAGSCDYDHMKNCTDYDRTTADSCNPTTGECIYDPIPTDGDSDGDTETEAEIDITDGDLDTENDTEETPACIPANCDDQNPYTTDICEAGNCRHVDNLARAFVMQLPINTQITNVILWPTAGTGYIHDYVVATELPKVDTNGDSVVDSYELDILAEFLAGRITELPGSAQVIYPGWDGDGFPCSPPTPTGICLLSDGTTVQLVWMAGGRNALGCPWDGAVGFPIVCH